MSSLIGHAAAGATVFLAHAPGAPPRSRMALVLLVSLALLPDLDYLPFWLFGIDSEPRWSHSLLFGLGASLLAWLALRGALPFAALALAACSHPLLDLLVGVHPVPLFWPLPLAQVESPIGLLPSAGRLSFTNIYLWRNLLIECLVLLPPCAIIVALARQVAWRRMAVASLVAGPCWALAVVWSLRIHG
ncbi:metal-dependent hydrolase [Massilia pseudoviolaceinigra]|uniref:metal-dependent hydrolase n=1 Tax=Massilia pseudoviolaceinigra TaxID=3057165 RepID=UPI002796828A|nr:metal-dependent hydrolase [Massilia sp. CCM 9206]MDQ1924070.1 metal-dependent hydrolase [Massilia sp. CCM 9206]